MGKIIFKHQLFWLVAFTCFFPLLTNGQSLISYEKVGKNTLSEKAQQHFQYYSQKENVETIELITVNTEFVRNESIEFSLKNRGIQQVAVMESEERENGINSYYGTLNDGSAIYFTVKEQQLISKFYDGENLVTILPLEGQIHMLIRYDVYADTPICGTHDSTERDHFNTEERTIPNDNGCKVRVLIGFTDDAVAVIPGDLHLFAYGAIDESNIAFINSNVVLRFEIATVRVFNVFEDLGLTNINSIDYSTELLQFFNNNAPYTNVNAYRNNYRADLNILVISQNMAGGTLFGQAMDVDVDEADAYAICSVPSITDGRFTFTHELGHIMGARHESPGSSYNRGMVIQPGGTNRQRTIMARTGAAPCGLATSCRVQHFSNPNINVGGNPTGVANSFDNARWLDEQANNIRNYRENWTNVGISPETINANVMGNYSADVSMYTIGNVICQNNGDLSFRAGTYIDLNNGFQIQNGGTFSAILGNCNANLPRLLSTNSGETEVISEIIDNPLAEAITSEAADAELFAGNFLKIAPNPMSDFLDIEFTVTSNGLVNLSIYDATGKKVNELVASNYDTGSHYHTFFNSQLTPGFYYLVYTSGDILETQKLIIAN